MNNVTAEEVTILTTKLIDRAYKEGRSTALDEVLEIVDARIELLENIERGGYDELSRYVAGATANDHRIVKNQIESLKGGEDEVH